jgi:hypothetical protein
MSVALDQPYCSLLDVQKETKNSGIELTDWYHTCINTASRWVEEHCRRDFRFHDYSEIPLVVQRRWVMGDTVYLPWPILTLTKLWVYSDRTIGKTSSDLWAAADYYAEIDERKQLGKISSESGDFGPYPFKLNMELEGTFGYLNADDDGIDETTIPLGLPTSIRKATAVIAATISMERRLEQTNLEGNRIELIELNIPTDVYKMLNKYRNFSYML